MNLFCSLNCNNIFIHSLNQVLHCNYSKTICFFVVWFDSDMFMILVKEIKEKTIQFFFRTPKKLLSAPHIYGHQPHALKTTGNIFKNKKILTQRFILSTISLIQFFFRKQMINNISRKQFLWLPYVSCK